MTKVKFRTQFNPAYKGAEGKVFKGESMTRPEDIMSLKQLLHNHTRNIQTNASHHEGIYTEEQVVPQIRDMNDIVEHRNSLNSEAAFRASLVILLICAILVRSCTILATS